MRFTERELTIAVTETAKVVTAAQRGKRLKAGDDSIWDQMSKIERYHAMEAIGSQILPVLIALPDVEVKPGTRPTFTDAQITAAAEPSLSGSGRLRRKVALTARIALVKTALAALPERHDPDALIIPDSL